MFESFESFLRIFTSPIWFLAAIAFGMLYYVQRSQTKLDAMPRNHECQKCKQIIDRHFPNTKFCLPCYEELKLMHDSWIKELQQCQETVGETEDHAHLRETYERAIELIDMMLDLKEQYPIHGLRFSDNLPTVKEAAETELKQLDKG